MGKTVAMMGSATYAKYWTIPGSDCLACLLVSCLLKALVLFVDL